MLRFAEGISTAARFRPAFRCCVFLVAAALAEADEVRLGVVTSWQGTSYNGAHLLLGVPPAIKAINDDPTTLPNHTLTWVWADTQCSGAQHALKAGLALLNGGVDAILGSPCSVDSLLVAPATAAYNVPFVSSYSVNSALSDKAAYPSFVRVLGTTRAYDNVAIGFLQFFGWSHAAIVYPETSGFAVGWASTMRVSLIDAGFTTDADIPYSTFGQQQVDQLVKTGARIVLWLDHDCERMRKVLLVARDHGILTGWVWMLRIDATSLDCWQQGDDRDSDALLAFNGLYSVRPFWHVDQASYDAMEAGRLSLEEFVSPWSNPYNLTYALEDMRDPDLASALTHDAILLYAKAAHAVLSAGGSVRDIETMRLELIDTEVEGMTGQIMLDENGDRKADAKLFNMFVGLGGDGLVENEVGHYVGNSESFYLLVPEASLVWAGGLQMKPAGDHFIWCETGSYLPAGSEICQQCEPGRYASEGAFDRGECAPCEAGRYAPLPASSDCIPCGVAISEACPACPAGSFRGEEGSCDLCPSGKFSKDAGSSECSDCPAGRYAEGSNHSACTACPEHETTLLLGSRSIDGCVCADGWYLPLAGADCDPCKSGMGCPTGSSERALIEWSQLPPGGEAPPFPQLLPGYWSSVDQPLSVYRCRNKLECPGAAAGTCAEGRDGICCGRCLPRHYDSDDGRCAPCSSTSILPLVFTVLAVVGCLVAIFKFANADTSRTSMTSVTAVLMAGQLVCTVQALSVFSQISVEWPEPLASLLGVAKLFALDLDMVRVQCVFQRDDPVVLFVVSLLAFPAFVAALSCAFFVSHLFKKGKFEGDKLFNSVGLVSLVVYISMTVMVLRPLHCVEHPNGLSSVASNPSIVCWDTVEHNVLMGLAIVGLLAYPIPIFSVVAHVTWRYPALVACGQGLKTFNRYRFLFVRFRPNRFYWGVCYLLRSFFISLAPVTFPNSSVWQVTSVTMIILLSLLGTSRLMPWRTVIANVTEIGLSVALMIVMQVGSFYLGGHESREDGKHLLGGFAMAILVAVLVAVLGHVGYAMYRYFFPRLLYGAFLCHHKEGAGSLARYVKMRMGHLSRSTIFLDSDHLEKLEHIFDIVRTDTQNLVVLLTKQTLLRPWCAGELASALVSGVPVVPVECDDYTSPDEETLAQLEDLWSQTQKHLLGQAGITLDLIQHAYRRLAEAEKISLKRFSPVEVIDAAIGTVVERCKVSRRFDLERVAAPRGDAPAQILMTSSAGDAEARCTCEVLRSLVSLALRTTASAAYSPVEAAPHLPSAVYLLVVLTRGVLEDSAFADLLLAVEQARRDQPVELVTALADSHFAFPAPGALAELRRRGDIGARLAAAFGRLLDVLAVPFSPHGSSRLIGTQVGELCRRLPRCAEGVAGRTHKIAGPAESWFGAPEAAADTGRVQVEFAGDPCESV